MKGPRDRAPIPEEQRFVELRQIIDRAISADKNAGVWDDITIFLRELGEKHPRIDLKDFRLYNLLMANTLRPDEAPASQFDLPGGEIEKFILGLGK